MTQPCPALLSLIIFNFFSFYSADLNLEISRRTVGRRIRDIGLRGRRTAEKFDLTEEHAQARRSSQLSFYAEAQLTGTQ